jgi:2-oxoglutarate dehydrogenase E2 component (dihydrolipoamide succinyltransferase)
MTEIILPSMGEGIVEATVTRILKQVGENVQLDEAVFEVATDKVDSEIFSPVDGVISEILCKEGDVVEIEKVIALVSTHGSIPAVKDQKIVNLEVEKLDAKTIVPEIVPQKDDLINNSMASADHDGKFFSPLVRSIAQKENISFSELQKIPGSGLNGRITKEDLMSFLSNRSLESQKQVISEKPVIKVNSDLSHNQSLEIVEMDRMRSLIADHMIESKRVSAHVTSFVEVDMTNIVKWRNRIKDSILKREGQKITFMPIFVDAVVRAIKEFPGVNVSVDGKKIIFKKDINIGMAAALPSGNLIVPVIKNADKLSLLGLTKEINDLAARARINKLLPAEITGGTFTITNMGTFGNITGTPIINQPQVAILAVGAIKKKPAVIETPDGDFIGIRHLMVMSMPYDHRVVDGAMGGMFLKKVADMLENFNPITNI